MEELSTTLTVVREVFLEEEISDLIQALLGREEGQDIFNRELSVIKGIWD